MTDVRLQREARRPSRIPPKEGFGVHGALLSSGMFIETSDRRRVFVRCWRQAGGVRAALALVPGLRSHGGLYEMFASRLMPHGIATYAVDLRGRGRSAGPRGGPGLLDGFGRDVSALTSLVRSREGARPMFLLGHGVGAIVAGIWAATHPAQLAGLICASAAFELPSRRGWSRALAALLPGEARATLEQLARCNAGLRAAATALTMPLLVVHGTADTVTACSGSEELHRLAGSRDKTLQIFEGYDHDLMTAPGNEQVTSRILDWLETRLGPGAPIEQIGIAFLNPE
jgi:alpha-beta hydrolase superfamily lysophospholipase